MVKTKIVKCLVMALVTCMGAQERVPGNAGTGDRQPWAEEEAKEVADVAATSVCNHDSFPLGKEFRGFKAGQSH